MDNVFIGEYFDWRQPRPSKKVEFINSILAKLGSWCRIAPPVFTGSFTNVERRMNIFHLVSQVLVYEVPGDLVELGCHVGQSSVLITRVIEYYDPKRKLHVYDSFEGLPDYHELDTGGFLGPRDLKASVEGLVENFKRYNVRLPEIHVGWFKDTLPTQLPEQICFAFLDGDLYESILISLEHVYPRLSKGAVCLIDDYADPKVHDGKTLFPGVKRACDQFLADKAERVSVLYSGEQSQGYFRKK